MTGPRLTVVPPLVERPLPVAWDDLPVRWQPAEVPGPVFVCPPPKPTPCAGCRQPTQPVASWRGLVEQPVPAYWRRDPSTGRPRHWTASSRVLARLRLTRCACGHDVVVDLETDEVWDLDETDYGPAGSVHPDQVQGQLW